MTARPVPLALPRLSREEARASSLVARALGGLDGAAVLADLRAVLGVAPAIAHAGARVCTAASASDEVGQSVGLVVAHGVHRGLVALAPGIARVVADRVVGGTGADVALGPTPLSRGEAGLVGYVVARALARAGASLVDAGSARQLLASWAEPRLVAIAFTLTIGEARGQGALFVPTALGLTLTPGRARIDPTLPIRASIVIGDARLAAREIATLALGDTVVPDTLTLDPRLADVGRARLVVGRSARSFELSLEGGAWRVGRATGISAPRAPARWTPRKGTTMSQPDTDTLQSIADVEVELSIELARLEMPVSEVASLAPGVVVTTGRLVGERVALRAGERVIAWGELVDVEGEVAVRLTEVSG